MSFGASLKLAAGVATFGLLSGLVTGILYKHSSSARLLANTRTASPVAAPLAATDPPPSPLTSAEWTATPQRVDSTNALRRVPGAAVPNDAATLPATGSDGLIGSTATAGSVMLQDPPGPRAVYARVEVVDARTFKTPAKTVRLAEIEALPLERTCRDAKGQAWPCGKRAQAALVTLLRGRPVTCFEVSIEGKDSVARCRVGRTDIAAWLVEQGWARPSSTNERLGKLQAVARAAHAGQFTVDSNLAVGQR